MRTKANTRRHKRSRKSAGREFWEHLESRILLSAGEWLVKFNNVPGDTRDVQLAYIQGLFHNAGLDSQGIQAAEHLGVDGVVIVQTDPSLNLYEITDDLRPLPGFASLEAWDDSTPPADRSIYIPDSPADEANDQLSPDQPVDTGDTGAGGDSVAAPAIVQSSTGFNGINDSQTAALSPPDSDGAVGPNSYIQAVNTALAIYNKTTGVPIAGGTITQAATFFGSLTGVLSFSDPIVVYNDITQRFFIGMIDYNTTTTCRLDVAISKSSNPLSLTSADWSFFRYNTNDGIGATFDFSDYPKIGYNADGYVVSFNMFPNAATFDHVSVLGIGNDGSSTGMRVMPGGITNFTLAPASMHGAAPGAPMWFVGDGHTGNGGNIINVVRLDNPFSAGAAAATTTVLNVPAFSNAPNPRQTGGTLGASTTLGTRFYFSSARTVGGSTYLASAQAVGNGTGVTARWYEFDISTGTPVIYQQGSINPNPATTDTYFPEVDIAPDGSLGMNYSESGTNEYMSMYVTGRRPSDPLGTMQTPILAKTNAVPLNAFGRAGDYSFTSVDPTDGTFWAVNEYASSLGSPNWATWIQHFNLGGLSVLGSTPAQGATLVTPTSTFVTTFTVPVDPASLQAGDLLVNGLPADGVSLSGDGLTATFTFNVSPVTTQGPQSMAMAAGAVSKLGNPATTFTAFNATFFYDAVPLTVISTNPPAGGSLAIVPSLTLDLNFSEPIAPGSVQVGDLTLSGIPGATSSALTILPGNTAARFTISGMTTEGALTVSLLSGAITDQFGNPNTAFTGLYNVDLGTVAYPVPLTAEAPPGSLIYDPSTTGVIGIPGDTDTFTISVDPGQTISVAVTPGSGLQPTIQLLDPFNNVVGTSTATAIGQIALLQTVPVTGAGGTYSIVVGGAGGSSGAYAVQLTLNAALEMEGRIAGVSNDSIATAQDLSGSFVAPNPNVPGVQRGAVLGFVQGSTSVLTNGGFESGAFSPWVTGVTGSPYMPWAVSGAGLGGNYGMLTTAPADGSFEAWNGFDGGGPMQYTMTQDIAVPAGAGTSLTWKDRLQWNFTIATGSALARSYFVELLNPTTNAVLATLYSFSTGPETTNPTGNTGWLTHSADVSAFAGTTVRLQFREVIPESFSGPAQAEIDSVGISAVPNSVDYYKFTLNAGESVTIAAASATPGVTLDLRNSSDTVLVTAAAGATNVSLLISNFVAPAAGTYYLRTNSTVSASYSLTIVKNAAFDAEPNDTFATAQNLSGMAAALGFLGGAGQGTLDSFDQGASDLANYTFTSTNNAGITAAAAHDGAFGLQLGDMTEWMYRNDAAAHVQQGSVISAWVQAGTVGAGRTYVGFGASSAGALSMVMGDNASALILQDNAGYQFSQLASVPQTWQAGHWYRFEITWGVGGLITGRLYDSNGTTLLNTVTATDNSITSGGLAFRGFGSTRFIDTVTTGAQGDSADWYSVNVATPGSVLLLQTTTPADGTGQFVNLLNPHIELYSPANVLLASGVVGSDGRNESLQFLPSVTGTYRVRVVSEGGTAGEYVLSSQIAPVSTIQNVAIDDGTAQRSRVRSITLTFSGTIVTAPSSAFTLTRSDSVNVPVVASSITTLPGNQTRITLTFTGGTLQGGSLSDGRYSLSINGNAIVDSFGQKLDANGTGPGSTRTVNFIRFFGDTNGDGIVDATDYLTFRAAYLTGNATGLNSAYDYNGDGVFTGADLQAFTNNMRIRVLP